MHLPHHPAHKWSGRIRGEREQEASLRGRRRVKAMTYALECVRRIRELVPELQRLIPHKEPEDDNASEIHLEHVLLALERGFQSYVAIGCAGHFLDGDGELYKVDNNLVKYDLTRPFSDQDEVLLRFLCEVLPDNT